MAGLEQRPGGQPKNPSRPVEISRGILWGKRTYTVYEGTLEKVRRPISVDELEIERYQRFGRERLGKYGFSLVKQDPEGRSNEQRIFEGKFRTSDEAYDFLERELRERNLLQENG